MTIKPEDEIKLDRMGQLVLDAALSGRDLTPEQNAEFERLREELALLYSDDDIASYLT